LLQGSAIPHPKGWGLIEASKAGKASLMIVVIPHPKGWGLIMGQGTASSDTSVPKARLLVSTGSVQGMRRN